VIWLLAANLGLSILLTIAVFILSDSVIDYQVSHAGVTDPRSLELLRTSASFGIWGRVFGNVVASVWYVFLARALLRGKRWGYRRVIWLSAAGIVSLVFLWTTPYPTWIRVEQVLQAGLLLAILYRVTRPEVRAYFAKQPSDDGGRGRKR